MSERDRDMDYSPTTGLEAAAKRAAAKSLDAVDAEAAIREDERQACWEDFIQVMRNAIKDAPQSDELKALHGAVFFMGWEKLGTGDGKPQHKHPDSAVADWGRTR